ncbi:hypothetical protein HLB23_40320 [Nocardia uniformis]|uniref:Uncharacterized protein n=1 Tax=Nocardia uniformis TaxID=53432 RepID=A0A849CGZ4_9NOCA|nr:hypothetical protein [Nocardia uniformis]NNH76027.1 hypothetical protein [Nocardia uniformis]
MSNQNGQSPIKITGAPDDLVHLLDWFRRDEALRGRVQSQAPQASDGHMGDLYDVLMVTLGAGGAATALVNSLRIWFTTRHAELTLTVTLPDGTEILLDGKRVKQDETFVSLQKMIETLGTGQ